MLSRAKLGKTDEMSYLWKQFTVLPHASDWDSIVHIILNSRYEMPGNTATTGEESQSNNFTLTYLT